MSKYQEGQEWIRKCGGSYAVIDEIIGDRITYTVYEIETDDLIRYDELPDHTFGDFYPNLKNDNFERCKNELNV